MSSQILAISTTCKTRVALEKPCKERQGIVIGQLKDSHDVKREFYNFEDIGCSQINENSRRRFLAIKGTQDCRAEKGAASPLSRTVGGPLSSSRGILSIGWRSKLSCGAVLRGLISFGSFHESRDSMLTTT